MHISCTVQFWLRTLLLLACDALRLWCDTLFLLPCSDRFMWIQRTQIIHVSKLRIWSSWQMKIRMVSWVYRKYWTTMIFSMAAKWWRLGGISMTSFELWFENDFLTECAQIFYAWCVIIRMWCFFSQFHVCIFIVIGCIWFFLLALGVCIIYGENSYHPSNSQSNSIFISWSVGENKLLIFIILLGCLSWVLYTMFWTIPEDENS